MRITIPEQIRNNAVALISLVIALSSLAYTGWRNETSEEQRNIRYASFQVLTELGELQELVLYNTYFASADKSAARPGSGRGRVEGYGHLLLVRDLMNLLPPPAPDAGTELFQVWEQQVDQLLLEESAKRQSAEKILSASIDDTRGAVLKVLHMLD